MRTGRTQKHLDQGIRALQRGPGSSLLQTGEQIPSDVLATAKYLAPLFPLRASEAIFEKCVSAEEVRNFKT